MKSVTKRTWWQPAIQFSVPTPKLQESTHETEKKVGLFYDVQVGCAAVPNFFHNSSLFRVPRSEILRTSGLASSGSEGRPQTFTECTAPRCTEALVPWIIWSWNWNSCMEFHGKRDAGAQAKQAFHKLPYESPLEKGHQGSSPSDPIRSVRSYQDTVYPVYICFEAHCVACCRRYPPRWTWRPAQLCWCWASGWEIFQERPRRSKMFMKSGQVHALSGPFILCHFIRNVRYSDIFWYSLTHFQSERPLDSLNSLPSVVGTDSAQHDIKLS